ncbi:hypothetical protein MRX96_042992, partial [Rhipicephalus microplus]
PSADTPVQDENQKACNPVSDQRGCGRGDSPREVDEEGNKAQPEQQQRRDKPALGRRDNEAGLSPAPSDFTASNAGYP